MIVDSRTLPSILFHQWKFWTENNRRFLYVAAAMAGAILLSLAIGIIPLAEFFHGGWSSIVTVAIQLLTFGAGAWAIWRSAQVITRLAVEEAVAKRVTASADDVMRKVRDEQATPPPLEHVPALFPDNHDDTLCSLRICHAIYADAMDRQFYNRETILSHYQDELADGIHEVQGYQRLALHLGIFGTFLGLAFAMPDIVRVANAQETVNFAELFGHLKICFNTSVVGLLASMIIWFAVLVAGQSLRRCITSLEHCTSSLLALVRNATNRFFSASSFEQVNNSMNQLATRIYDQNLTAEKQTAAINGGMEKLHGARATLDEFVQGFAEVKVKLLEEAAKLGAELSPTKFFDRVDKDLTATLGGMSTKIQESVTKGLQSLEQSNSALNTNTEATTALVKQLLAGSADVRRDQEAFMERIKTWQTSNDQARQQEYETRDRRHEDHLRQTGDRFDQILKQRDELFQLKLQELNDQRERDIQRINAAVAEAALKLGVERNFLDDSRRQVLEAIRALNSGIQQIATERSHAPAMLKHLEILSDRAQRPLWNRWFSRSKSKA